MLSVIWNVVRKCLGFVIIFPLLLFILNIWCIFLTFNLELFDNRVLNYHKQKTECHQRLDKIEFDLNNIKGLFKEVN